MKQRRRRAVPTLVGGLTAASLVLVGLAATPATAVRSDPTGDATSRLHSDAPRGVTFERDAGRYRFVGTAAGRPFDNPEVTPRMSAADAARRHLRRYGAALGTSAPGSTFEAQAPQSSPSGIDVVRYDQSIDGVPVIGAQVVLGLDPEGQMVSASSSTSTATVSAAQVTEDEAARAATLQVTRTDGGRELAVTSVGRRVYDPSVLGATSTTEARSGWAFEVRGAGMLNRLVLVDDHDGRVLLDLDQNRGINRVVCDNANVARNDVVPCTSGVARTEASGPTGASDVDHAFDAAGATAATYAELADIDLTSLLGITVAGEKAIASTVAWCFTGEDCPFPNAFWDGHQMYYGTGYADAVDVVGHELTHGVIERYSNLFYWGQSGAINESIADVLGEIVQHRNATSPAQQTNWDLGEDLPGGATRSMLNPTLHGQPDWTGSTLYTADDEAYDDNGGVHTDSGVGNKTAYLISQGGTFRGTTVVGIDAGDPGLNRTGTLYADVLMKLSSGSDYADLADVLEQSCSDLVSAGEAGFTAANCDAVHAATVATGLRTTPRSAPQPADAPQTCPKYTTKRVLLESETGDPASTFTATGSWVRGQSPYYGANATSGSDSWSITAPWSGKGVWQEGTLSAADPIEIPSGQQTFLWFENWYLLDYVRENGASTFYDAGLVNFDRRIGDGAGGTVSGGTSRGEDLDWINGPTARKHDRWWGAYRDGFSGDSRGWVASRAELTSLGGSTIVPEFELATDGDYLMPGWFLDDIVVYTCDPVPLPKRVNLTAPHLVGPATVGSPMRVLLGTWSPALNADEAAWGMTWFRDGVMLNTGGPTYIPVAADVGHRISATVSPYREGYESISVSAGSFVVKRGTFRLLDPKIRGLLKVGQWIVGPSARSNANDADRLAYQWKRNGKPIRKATKFQYKLTKKDAGKRISVTVTISRPGFTTLTRTVSAAKKVRR